MTAQQNHRSVRRLARVLLSILWLAVALGLLVASLIHGPIHHDYAHASYDLLLGSLVAYGEAVSWRVL